MLIDRVQQGAFFVPHASVCRHEERGSPSILTLCEIFASHYRQMQARTSDFVTIAHGER